jgi:hypothetical protein
MTEVSKKFVTLQRDLARSSSSHGSLYYNQSNMNVLAKQLINKMNVSSNSSWHLTACDGVNDTSALFIP